MDITSDDSCDYLVDVYADEDSGSDKECLTREAMKKRTASLVNSKTNKKPLDGEEEDDAKKRKRC